MPHSSAKYWTTNKYRPLISAASLIHIRFSSGLSSDIFQITKFRFSLITKRCARDEVRKNSIRIRSKTNQPYNLNNLPASIYLLKVSNRNTRRRCEICSKLSIKISSFRLVNLFFCYSGFSF